MLLFFDFDGTIADSLDTAILVLNEIGHEYQLPIFTKEEILSHKGKSISEIIQITGMKYWQIPSFLMRARAVFYEYMLQVQPFPEMLTILQQLADNEHELVILTSNAEKNVRFFLEKHQVSAFSEIYAPSFIFGKSSVIKKVMKQKKYTPETCWMIGDEERDVLAAHKAGVNSVAVSWGFNDKTLLKKANPTHLLDSPSALLSLFLR
ncbi:MAG: HAD family hydrolase [Bacteroidia bacterium]